MAEGESGNPLNEIEAVNAMKNVAKMAWALYEGLVGEGFSEADSLKMVLRYLHGAAGGKAE